MKRLKNRRRVSIWRSRRAPVIQNGFGSFSRQSVLVIPNRKIISTAKFVFNFFFKITNICYIIPFEREGTGLYSVGSLRRRVIFYTVCCGLVISVLQNGFVVASLLSTGNLDIETLVCICRLLILVTGSLLPFISAWKPQETAAVLNSWDHVTRMLETMQGKVVKEFDEITSSIQIVALMAMMFTVAIALSIGVVLYPGAPAWALIHFVVKPRDGEVLLLPTWMWKVILLPFELVFMLPPLCGAAFVGCIFSVALGVLRLIVYHIRKCGIENIGQRRKLERLYVRFELHSRILNAWLWYVFPPTIIAFFWTVVITLFIAIRHTDLPLYFYMFFPIIGSSVMATLFLVSYHMHCVSTGAETVVASLMEQQTNYVKVMTKEDQIKLLKRVKAFRQFKIVLGPFANFSLSFPVDLWEEVINQLLFLMSF